MNSNTIADSPRSSGDGLKVSQALFDILQAEEVALIAKGKSRMAHNSDLLDAGFESFESTYRPADRRVGVTSHDAFDPYKLNFEVSRATYEIADRFTDALREIGHELYNLVSEAPVTTAYDVLMKDLRDTANELLAGTEIPNGIAIATELESDQIYALRAPHQQNIAPRIWVNGKNPLRSSKPTAESWTPLVRLVDEKSVTLFTERAIINHAQAHSGS